MRNRGAGSPMVRFAGRNGCAARRVFSISKTSGETCSGKSAIIAASAVTDFAGLLSYLNTMQLRGCGTALVTPFHQDGSLDLEALRNLVAWQVESGIDFLVPCGTTGET